MAEGTYDKLTALSRELNRPINRPELEPKVSLHTPPAAAKDCLFCSVASRASPSYIFDENEDFVAFLDIQPKAVGHTVIIPKSHVEKMEDLDGVQSSTLVDFIARVAKALKKALGATGYTTISMNGLSSGQAIPHVSFHVIPTYAQDSVEMHMTSQLATQKLPPFVLKDVHMRLSSVRQLAQNTRMG